MLFTRVRIVGDSMTPTLAAGQWWVVRRTRRVRAGDVIVLEHPQRLGQLVVKRAIKVVDGRWWVEGDNPAASDDSRSFGPIEAASIVGRLAWRYGREPLR